MLTIILKTFYAPLFYKKLKEVLIIDKNFICNIRKEIIGIDTKVPLISGDFIKYINFDNAASTPSFKQVFYKLEEFLHWYSNVHRGSGFKSQLSTEIFQKSRQIIADFVGADTDDNTLIFLKNTTEAINKLANIINFEENDIILTTVMEHHSNFLPWRRKAEIIYINLTKQGLIDLNDLEEKLKKYSPKVKLVAITGASNITGYITPIHQIATLTHYYDSKLFVDAAQLAPHRPINIKANSDSEHIDFISFSAHKIYAPFGCGVLIGAKETFNNEEPDYSGGGTVKAVTSNDVIWADLPDKEEAGTPNILGAIALAESIRIIEGLGWKRIIANEEELLSYTLDSLKELTGITLYSNYNIEEQVGVIPFNIQGLSDSLVATILSREGGIGARNGCLCAHPYINHLLKLSKEEQLKIKESIRKGDYTNRPGLVRISFGCYNTIEEVDRFLATIKSILVRKNNGEDLKRAYYFNHNYGEYQPKQDSFYGDYFSI